MSEAPQQIRKELLAQNEPTRERRIQYEREAEAMLKKLETGLRREAWGVGILWIYGVIFMTAALFVTAYRNQNRPEVSILAFAFMLTIFGSVELIKHVINRSRVEVLKELKGLELQLLDLKSQLPEREKK